MGKIGKSKLFFYCPRPEQSSQSNETLSIRKLHPAVSIALTHRGTILFSLKYQRIYRGIAFSWLEQLSGTEIYSDFS